MIDIDSEIAGNFIAELDALLEKFDGVIMNVTLIGCLDLVKAQLIADSLVEVRPDDSEGYGGNDEED
jgi:hypothetical protein